MKLSHYTDTPITVLHDIDQCDDTEPLPFEKPRGLWLSVDGDYDWTSYCDAIAPDRIGGQRQTVTLKPDAKVLVLPRDMPMEAFTEKYEVPFQLIGLPPLPRLLSGSVIDWCAVSKEYDGIIIAPYQHHHRRNMNWYYLWDCASGCIWNTRAIEEIR